jgi:excinuclease UvrABC nuclease subunit
LALERAKAELTSALDDAPWIPPTRRQRLLAEIDGLAEETKAKPDQRAFASSVTEVADQIDAAFGLSG